MSASWLIAGKDLRLRLRDRSAIIVGIIAPLGLAFIFNLVLGNVPSGEFVPKYAVVDLDQGPVARGLTDVLEQIEGEGAIELADAPGNVADAEQLVADGSVATVIVIPGGFSAAVQAGEPSRIALLADPDQPLSAEIARSIVEGLGAEVRAGQLSVFTALQASGRSPSLQELRELGTTAASTPNPISIGRVDAATRELDLATFFAASMSIFFLFFTVSFGVNGLLEEGHQGTLPRLLAAPIRSSAIIGGKALVSFALGLVSMTILIVASGLLLDASWGNPIGVALLVIAGVLAATGLMTVVAAFARTPAQAGNLQAILAVSLGMLGGIFFPTSLGTGLLASLAYISPHRWFLTGLGDLSAGGDLSVIVPSIIGLLTFAAVSAVIAAFRFRRGLVT